MTGLQVVFLLGVLQLFISLAYASPVEECPSGASNNHIADSEDCTKYYQCLFGTALERECPSGLYFDPTNWICNYPHLVDCAASTTEEPEEGDATTTQEPDIDEEGSGELEYSTEDNVNENSWIGECPLDDSSITYLQHASDCNKYFVCENGSPTLMSCYTGLHFNIDLGICDWPESAGCEVDLFIF